MDPVSSLWRCLRKGVPLMTIYNVLQPVEPLRIEDSMPESRKPKAAAFKFVKMCLEELRIPPGDCFTISDLFGDDTTGFVKVCNSLRLYQVYSRHRLERDVRQTERVNDLYLLATILFHPANPRLYRSLKL